MVESRPVAQLLAILAERRRAAAAVPQKVEVLHALTTELGRREDGLIQADTSAQAQAQLLQILKNVTSQQLPPLEIKQIEFAPPRQLTDAYGEVSVSITLECTIDELLNLVADLTAQSEVIATEEISLVTANEVLKTLKVRLTVMGLITRTLIAKPRGL